MIREVKKRVPNLTLSTALLHLENVEAFGDSLTEDGRIAGVATGKSWSWSVLNLDLLPIYLTVSSKWPLPTSASSSIPEHKLLSYLLSHAHSPCYLLSHTMFYMLVKVSPLNTGRYCSTAVFRVCSERQLTPQHRKLSVRYIFRSIWLFYILHLAR